MSEGISPHSRTLNKHNQSMEAGSKTAKLGQTGGNLTHSNGGFTDPKGGSTPMKNGTLTKSSKFKDNKPHILSRLEERLDNDKINISSCSEIITHQQQSSQQ